jgi:uncharacterized glyoxalase superfamily protein PhnB
MAASLRFYRLLGLDIPEGSEQEPHVESTTSGLRIAWDTIDVLRGVYDEWVEQPIGHRIELAFACESRDEVDTLYGQIVEQGYRGYKAPWDAFWGQRYAVVEDPDGNLISLFS